MSLRIETTALVVDHPGRVTTVRALWHPGLVVEAGTSVAVMGPSGCGKSTLLGLLAGLAVPTSGSVTLGETVVSGLAEQERAAFRRRHVGMVHQADNLLPHLTAEENVALAQAVARPARARGAPPAALADPVSLLDRLGLSGLGARLPDQLSGGQRQRVAIARAVACGPGVILADEPTGALDGGSARQVVELLVEVQRELGATLVIVTHDPAVAERADRVEHLSRPRRSKELAGAGPGRPR
ncbi:MAG: ATP-binding cassette domain-containing protein [Acidimicrobiales bacterium]|nr:ATP-binding cassette domain-containing protein [Acidimicrobiales bacterium]MCB9371745.1 ATP-binding cassette domain-containing protein [Microthrixaceae bacterium]